MFENFPLLKGLYMTYGQYYAVSFSLVFFMKFIIFWIIGTYLYDKSKVTRKLKTDNLQVKVQGYRDVVRVLGFLSTTFSIFCLIATFTSLNAFRLVPLWVAIIGNIIALTFLLAFTLLKMDSVKMKDFTISSGYTALLEFRLSKLFKYIVGFIFLYGIMLPVFFQGTCICFFEEDRSYLLSLKALRLPGSFNTAFFRLFLIDKICADRTKPCHIYATLPEESSTQVFINVHTHKDFNKPLSMTYSDGKSGVHFNVTKSQVFEFNDLEPIGERYLHTFFLKDLTPDTIYTLSFVLKGVKHTYKYRTLVSRYTKTRPIRIVNGGDVGNSVNANLLWEQIAKQDPDVVFIGGDLAYDNNLPDCYWAWDLYIDQFDLLSQRVGRLVPFIQAIGNHDAGLNPFSKTTIPFGDGFANPQYLSYFPHHLNNQNTIPYISQRKTYFATKLGQAVYFTLDSGYLVSYQEQAAYIDKYIAENKPVNKFAQYHHPIYSATTIIDYEGINFQEGSLYWVSRFDKYNFNTIYENHQHIHKRTKLLKGHLEHPEGTLYLGDGCWGADVTGSEINKHDYLDNAQRFNTVWISDIFEEYQYIQFQVRSITLPQQLMVILLMIIINLYDFIYESC